MPRIIFWHVFDKNPFICDRVRFKRVTWEGFSPSFYTFRVVGSYDRGPILGGVTEVNISITNYSFSSNNQGPFQAFFCPVRGMDLTVGSPTLFPSTIFPDRTSYEFPIFVGGRRITQLFSLSSNEGSGATSPDEIDISIEFDGPVCEFDPDNPPSPTTNEDWEELDVGQDFTFTLEDTILTIKSSITEETIFVIYDIGEAEKICRSRNDINND